MHLFCSFSEGNDAWIRGFSDESAALSSNGEATPDGMEYDWKTGFSLFKDIPENAYMYLVHSYYVALVTETVATATYGLEYSVAIQKIIFLGVGEKRFSGPTNFKQLFKPIVPCELSLLLISSMENVFD